MNWRADWVPVAEGMLHSNQIFCCRNVNEYMASKYPRNKITSCVVLGKLLLMFTEVYLHKPKQLCRYILLLSEVSVGKGSEHWHVPHSQNFQVLF